MPPRRAASRMASQEPAEANLQATPYNLRSSVREQTKGKKTPDGEVPANGDGEDANHAIEKLDEEPLKKGKGKKKGKKKAGKEKTQKNKKSSATNGRYRPEKSPSPTESESDEYSPREAGVYQDPDNVGDKVSCPTSTLSALTSLSPLSQKDAIVDVERDEMTPTRPTSIRKERSNQVIDNLDAEGPFSSPNKAELGFESTRIIQEGDAESPQDAIIDEEEWQGIVDEQAQEVNKERDGASEKNDSSSSSGGSRKNKNGASSKGKERAIDAPTELNGGASVRDEPTAKGPVNNQDTDENSSTIDDLSILNGPKDNEHEELTRSERTRVMSHANRPPRFRRRSEAGSSNKTDARGSRTASKSHTNSSSASQSKNRHRTGTGVLKLQASASGSAAIDRPSSRPRADTSSASQVGNRKRTGTGGRHLPSKPLANAKSASQADAHDLGEADGGVADDVGERTPPRPRSTKSSAYQVTEVEKPDEENDGDRTPFRPRDGEASFVEDGDRSRPQTPHSLNGNLSPRTPTNRGRSQGRHIGDKENNNTQRSFRMDVHDDPEMRRLVRERVASFHARQKKMRPCVRPPAAAVADETEEGETQMDFEMDLSFEEGQQMVEDVELNEVSVVTEHRIKKAKHKAPLPEDLEKHKHSLQNGGYEQSSANKPRKRPLSEDGGRVQSTEHQSSFKKAKTSNASSANNKSHETRSKPYTNGRNGTTSRQPMAERRSNIQIDGGWKKGQGAMHGYALGKRAQVATSKEGKDTRGQTVQKRARSPVDESFDIDASPPKRRKGMTAEDKKARAIARLLRPIEDDEIGDEDDGEAVVRRGSARPDQIGYYSGLPYEMLVEARESMRFFIFTDQPFCPVGTLILNAKQFYVGTSIDRFGSKYKELAPRYTRGMQKLLKDEAWMLRHRVKTHAQSFVERYYGLFPRPEDLEEYEDPEDAEEATKLYTRNRVAYLTGKESLFLYPSAKKDSGLPFTHIAIKSIIMHILFNPKSRPKALALVDIDSLDPIPVVCIAYAATAVRCALEEYKSGDHVEKEFSEVTYKGYYNKLLRNLIIWRDESSRSRLLQKYCHDMFLSGQARLDYVEEDDTRPDGPFVLSDQD
ncbi:hypothetical protein SCHPADRAFT_889221 [Schizopora paradoxa]|uniref:DUF6532 domain-containing protein n=1 Tax=Schizopora paradoxa TaxID=27342 RepID=A0A0H2RRF5_9AGAM|nr:hypothetical protein SCHPADRAFT_889221 [Schizopora paradoxa]